jgi:hypothetical protein
MSSPTNNLANTFGYFWNDFNNVQHAGGDYTHIKQYLRDHVTMVRVDDFDAVTGSAQYIVNYLNQTQGNLSTTPKWPQFNPTGTPTILTHYNGMRVPILGDVTGAGTYKDTRSSMPINVSYSFRYKPNTNGIWLIGYASATPTP